LLVKNKSFTYDVLPSIFDCKKIRFLRKKYKVLTIKVLRCCYVGLDTVENKVTRTTMPNK